MLASKYDYGQISIVQNIADKVTEPCWGIKNCQFVAAICRKLLATANSLPQFAGSFWQLPIRCRNLQEAFGSCQFVAAICRKLLATANSLPQFAGSFWQLPIRCRNLQEAFDTCQNVAAICRKLLTVSDAVDAISDAWNTPSECWSVYYLTHGLLQLRPFFSYFSSSINLSKSDRNV